MSFNRDEESHLNIYGGLLIENHKGLKDNGIIRSMMRQRLVEQLASRLASDALSTTEGTYSTEYRMEVYVLTPQQLEKYVQRRAERLHTAMPDVRWVTS